MGSSTDDFTALRALLKLKQYEQPPPRFFDELARSVHRRLRGPEGLRSSSLFGVLGLHFGWRPALFYGLGVACCVLALYAVVYLLVHGPPPVTVNSEVVRSSMPGSPEGGLTPSSSHLLSGAGAAPESAQSTNPVLSPGNVTFPVDGTRLKPTPVRFQPKP